MVLGVGGDIQTDVFSEQASDVVSSAIQTVRARARARLQEKMQASYAAYSLEQGLVDIQRYDQETCTLNVGLNELRASLISGPQGNRSNEPILPLPPTPLFDTPLAPQQVLGPSSAPPASPAVGLPKGPANSPPRPQLALQAAIDRINKTVNPAAARSAVFEACYEQIGLPKGFETSNLLSLATDNSKIANLTRCLNSFKPVSVVKPALPSQKLLANALHTLNIDKLLTDKEKKDLATRCLQTATLPDNTKMTLLLAATLSEDDDKKVGVLASCLSRH